MIINQFLYSQYFRSVKKEVQGIVAYIIWETKQSQCLSECYYSANIAS